MAPLNAIVMRMVALASLEQGTDGVGLFYELHAGAMPVVLVHGSWHSHRNWDLVVPRLAEVFRVLTYDRRGHSQSERPTGQGSVREDVADLAVLLEHLGSYRRAWSGTRSAL